MTLEEDFKKALGELRKEPERKFNQSVDLLINLQKFDVRKTNVNIFVSVPHKIKDKRIGAFFEAKNHLVETITKEDFKKYAGKNAKKLINQFDFFIAQASLMPSVATTFGRALGPSGKMPSPQMGILINADDKAINELKERINSSVRIKVKESSVKLSIGKQNMKDEDLVENAMAIYNALLKVLPRDKENIKNIELKLTMSKPQKIKLR